jgi:hypothetical protein
MGRSYQCFHVSSRLAVSDARVALPNFYNVAVRITDVAARLAVLGLRLGEKFGSSASPQLEASLNICDADIHEAAYFIGFGRDAERYRRFVGRRTAPGVYDEPRVRDLDVSGRALYPGVNGSAASAANAIAMANTGIVNSFIVCPLMSKAPADGKPQSQPQKISSRRRIFDLRRPSSGGRCGLLLYRCHQRLRGRTGGRRILSRDQQAVADHVNPPVLYL